MELENTAGEQVANDAVQNSEPVTTNEPAAEARAADPLADAISKALAGNGESKSEEEPTDAPEPEKVKSEAPPAPALEAKQHWPQEAKDLLAILPDDVSKQKFAEFVRKGEAEITKYSQAKSTFERFGGEIRQFGLNDVGEVLPVLSQFAQLNQSYQRDPIATIEYLAKQKGIDLRRHYSGEQTYEEEYTDPKVRQLEDRLSNYERQIEFEKQQKEQAQRVEVQRAIKEFSEAKDESGALKYQHFDRLKQEMSQLLGAGIAQSMEDAYDLALYKTRELYQQEIERKQKADREAWERARLEEVKKAEAASKHLSGTGATRAAPKIRTVEDAVRAALRKK